VLAGKTSVLVHNADNNDNNCHIPGVGDFPAKVVNSNMGHIDAAGRSARSGGVDQA
jgi:hypothetical protein